MIWKVRDHDCTRGNGMNVFESKQLAGTDKSCVVAINEVKRESGEEIGEEKVKRKISVRIVEKIEPTFAGS